ncbi:hypothetical protein BABINDRAFT_6860 [Babjeviella inositovora NRRL Y-12698]|uniref:BSD domain-containing protein n=1 Tax=Babjeviella inositovora NRRL Y-12698 TaxID=984486 RepID=A0A1E3QTK1_9ASCO|nr:uncharacterized protein BABINDRAFT_6860 [Babjeviella inositovora NRRL Y-12698]ODQ81008.1 hypothetical protein BABINDRAFT_6860 [Babjeviella inositovora NRRL Y-12698]
MSVTGAAAYKKRAGMLSIQEELLPPILVWKSIDSSVPVPVVELPLRTLTNLQATPVTLEKMMLKVVSKGPEDPETLVTTVFSFNHRPTMNNIRDALQQIISRQKTVIQPGLSPAPGDATQANDAPANGSLGTFSSTDSLTEAKLLRNHTLQQKLLRAQPALFTAFQETVIKGGLHPDEFWSTRIHLLRTFALESSQRRGPYNVLSTIKTVATSDNQVNVSISIDKIQAIFEQYPVVRKAYDENVPKLSEGEFWTRFFCSKLFRKLKGEKIGVYDKGDLILDKYCLINLDYLEKEDEEDEEHIPRFLDLEGNKDDNSQKLGNGPDVTMKGDNNPEIVLILRSMNKLSTKIVSNCVPHGETFEELEKEKEEELEFKDLEETQPMSYIELHVNSQHNSNSSKTDTEVTIADADKVDAGLPEFKEKMKDYFTTELDLTELYSAPSRKRSAEEAFKDTIQMIKANTKQLKQTWNVTSVESLFSGVSVVNVTTDIDSSLPDADLETLRLTQATSMEFLKHFWVNFTNRKGVSAAGNPAMVRKLYASLKKCQERVESSIQLVAAQNPVKPEPETEKSEGEAVEKPVDNVHERHARDYMGSISRSLLVAIDSYESAVKKVGGVL